MSYLCAAGYTKYKGRRGRWRHGRFWVSKRKVHGKWVKAHYMKGVYKKGRGRGRGRRHGKRGARRHGKRRGRRHGRRHSRSYYRRTCIYTYTPLRTVLNLYISLIQFDFGQKKASLVM